MRKLSSSDITPEDEAREAAARANLRQLRSSHFNLGTTVIYNRQRYTVLDKARGLVALRDSGGREILIRPFFAQWDNR